MFYSSLFTKECQYGYNMRMPKKTRKEKIRAKHHRHVFKTTSVETESTHTVVEKKSLESESITAPTFQLTAEEKSITQYFKTDLRKSLIIIASIFALEFFFYFATMNNYLARYLKF